MQKPDLILVDGSSYLFRAYHALPPLTTSDGTPTGAMYGVINMVGKLLDTYQPQRIAVVFDARGKNFRHEMYEAYKANRPPMPDDLAQQIEPLHQFIRALGIPVVVIDGVEADDVIGTLATQAAREGKQVLISTGDKDMAQLVNDHITLIDTMKDQILERDGVIKKYGVAPEQMVDYLALMGDSSDNIPGVPKVGPKTAAKWLQQYGDLDALIAHADEIKGKVGENLRAHLDQLRLSRELTRIRTDLDLPIRWQDLVKQPEDDEKLLELIRRYEFNSWLNRKLAGHPLFGGSEDEKNAPAQTNTTQDVPVILDDAALNVWVKRLKKAELFAIDCETTALDPMRARLVGISFAVADDDDVEAAYLPLAHDYPGVPEQLPIDQVLETLRPLLEQAPKAGQNLKYDWHVFKNAGITLEPITHDTMLQSYVLNSTERHGLDELALKYLGHRTTHYTDVAGKGRKQINFAQVPLEQAAPYAAEDAELVLRLHKVLWPKLEQDEKLRHIYEGIEIPLEPVLARMEHTGVLLDAEQLKAYSKELAKRLKELEQQAWKLAGEEFNLNSPQQLQTILFDKLGLPVLKKTPKGQPSTAESVLQELAEQGHELPKLILEYRGLAKLKSTYTDALVKQIDPDTGRVHTSYQQAVTATGRLSSTDPNLQNIPVRTPEGRRIRQAFIAPQGSKILAADYSQIELRIMAHFSGDENLIKAFEQGLDIHRATAAEIFGVPVDEVTPEMRRHAKTVNFGLIYGMSAYGLAQQLEIDRKQAQAYIDTYFERYPGVRRYMDEIREKAKQQGYVETLMGRRLYLPDIHSKNPQVRQYAERAAINAPLQGTAADIIKTAMIRIDAWLREDLPADALYGDTRMILQVHDELVFEVPGEVTLEHPIARTIRETMESAMTLRVPLVADVGIGPNWEAAH
ncbi:DNA polymerase I [Sulfurivirga caldicuralii]|uniref:DNA polymerase I n=1 Tax=Sulfurivirga caldicuralii TaxID=364032 RepID=A0A1N6HAD8_9GAMM|nr:DNA polymerase I [Sulfurivirga caldicuralii]SIO16798.1 DNA polymerase I [Sulfurivirga caldicuralii]